MKHLLFTLALTASGLLNCQAATVSKIPQPNKLWYNKPAYAFEESLPIGNGKLGALIYGAHKPQPGQPRHQHQSDRNSLMG